KPGSMKPARWKTKNRGKLKMTQEETKVDVSDDFRRAMFSDGGPLYVDGVRITVAIPYKGDTILWQLKPSPWKTIFPQGDIRETGTPGNGILELVIEQPVDEEPTKIKEALDRLLENIRFSQREQTTVENSRLPELIQPAISKRRALIGKHENLSELLSIPLKKSTTVTPKQPPTQGADSLQPEDERAPSRPRPANPRQKQDQANWDVFISHASEDKESFVRDLAQALQGKGLKVWYDDFTLTVGDSLRRSIDRGLSRSRYGIVVISHNFLHKEWPQKELDGLVAREVAGQKVILPVCDNVDAETVRTYSPTLSDRLATSSSKGLDQVVLDLLGAIRAH
ncbi:MAG: TIR domain-containing protein, partial [Acidobacteriota bacterium]